ncbi:efflux RND transporter periplasmic adaptor subunit [Sphingomonas azotifigens]|uniref:efflux RND transporter periplasmic adaptor subunit n=1 Tax=Sphingomonas azotifigens TaxID=330920 RepID=UPI001430B015|nr:efflux RND transporter periplasmic adaptor subunit [Sphingomonas azotifigens]
MLAAGTGAFTVSHLRAAHETASTVARHEGFLPSPQQRKALTIETVGSMRSAGSVIEATGTIAVDGNHSTPVSPPYSGLVTRLLVEPGQRVAKGQPLMIIESVEYVEARDALASASAQYRAADAQLRLARQNADRYEALYRTAGGALKDYQQGLSAVATAQGTVQAAQASVSAARGKLAVYGMATPTLQTLEIGRAASATQAIVRAPIAGVIARRDVSAGQFIDGKGSAAFVITEPSTVWLIAQIAESDAAQVSVGDAVTVTTPAWPGRRFTARVAQVGAGLDPESHRLPVRATIANADGALKPDMFASFSIQLGARPAASALLIAASAVIREGEESRVWIARHDGTLVPRVITTGERANGKVHVLSGLRPGERIVTGGALFVNEAGTQG